MFARVCRAAALLLAASAMLGTAAAAADPHLDGEFEVSSLDTNSKITGAPDGSAWVTLAFNAGEKDVARIAPSGEVTEYNLEATNPLGITTGPEGRIWITQNGGVTSFSPSDPEGSKKFIEANEIVGDHAIVTGPDGNLWVATDNNLVRIEPGTEKTKAFAVGGLAPKDIDVAGSVLAVASQGHIVTATTADPPAITEFEIAGLASQGVAGAPSGQIAFSDPVATPEQVGLITPPNPAKEMELKGDPFGVTFGPDGAFWIAQAGPPEQLTRLTTDGQTTSLTGFAAGFKPRQITAGVGNTLWVTLENAEFEGIDRVARISGVEAPKSGSNPTPPGTKIGKGPKGKVKTRKKKARVKFRFSSDDPAAGFECSLVRLKKKQKAKAAKPRFKPCRSPKVYRLAPGRYQFQVRAVASGLADPTPAKRAFRVVHKH